MEHKQTGLARKCHPTDLFISGTGLQCGNCMAYEPRQRVIPVEFAIEFTGVLQDKWLGGERWTDRSEAQRTARYLRNQKVWFDNGQRAAYSDLKVVEVKHG